MKQGRIPYPVHKLLKEMAAQDEFTGATPDNLPLWQAYALLNSWRMQAIKLLGVGEREIDS